MSNTKFLNSMMLLFRTLTVALKQKYFERIIERDNGFFCFYCKKELSIKKFDYEHINNDRTDNRIENIVFACRSCNNKKSDDESMKKLALEKLEENESNVLRERNFEKRETSVEIDTNAIGMDMAEEYLKEKLEGNEEIDYDDTLCCINYRIRKKLGHSSEVTVRRHLRTLTCSEAPYEEIKDGNGRRIRMRNKKEEELVNGKASEIIKEPELERTDQQKEMEQDYTNHGLELPVELALEDEPSHEKRQKIIKLAEMIHNEQKCEACKMEKEVNEESERIEAINHEADIDWKNVDDALPTVGHCTSFFCDKPTFDGDHWCGRCVGFWSKMMSYPNEEISIGV